MTSLGTDFEKRAEWQEYVEEPAAKDSVARKVHTIKLTKVQGTSWNTISAKSTWEVIQKLLSDKQQSTLIH